MKTKKQILFRGTIVALPFIAVAYRLFNPAQCSPRFTQAQVEASNCIVGPNFGGLPLFATVSVAIWLFCVWLIRKLSR